jgi:DnaJ like chaperone protein
MFSIFGAIVGYSIYRFPGAIAGYFLGSFIDQMNGKKRKGAGQRDVFRGLFDQQRGKTVNPADFEINLLSLASFVIKADGKVSQSELDFVRQYFVQAYGKERAKATCLLKVLQAFFAQKHGMNLDYKFCISYLALPMQMER